MIANEAGTVAGYEFCQARNGNTVLWDGSQYQQLVALRDAENSGVGAAEDERVRSPRIERKAEEEMRSIALCEQHRK